MSIATARISRRQAAQDRFYRAALWHAADPACSSAYSEFEDAYEALSAFSREALPKTLTRADARRRQSRTLTPGA